MHPALLAAAVILMPVVSDAPPPKPGTITVVASGTQTVTDPMVATFVGAVSHAVLQTGFVPLPDTGHSRYVAKVEVSQTSRGVVTATGNGPGSAPSVNHQGSGLSLSLPSGKRQLHGLVVTRLAVIVTLRSDSQIIWSGTATTARVDGTQAGAPAAVAAALSDALFARFPQPLPGPLSVP